jgi:hypothetical protein
MNHLFRLNFAFNFYLCRYCTEPQPEWTKTEGAGGEARIVYTNKATTAGVEQAKVAGMDSSLRARFQGLLGGLAGGVLRTCTRPKLNLLLLLRASV